MTAPQAATIEIQAEYAGFWLRLAAALLDALVIFIPLIWLIMIVLILLKVSILTFFKSFATNDDANAIEIIILFTLLPFLAIKAYGALMESSRLQATIGKLAVGIYVTDLQGHRITRGRAGARTFAKLLSSMTIGIGYALCAFTGKKQALHDLITKSLVLRGRRPFRSCTDPPRLL